MRSGCGGREERLERRRIVPAECGCDGREERLERRRIVPAEFGCGGREERLERRRVVTVRHHEGKDMKRLKKAGICVLAAAVVCCAAAGLFACNDEQAPKELAYVYGAAETVTPFWMNTYGDETVVYNEVVTPILHPFSDTAYGYLAYEPTRVISVRDYTLGIEYDADDYTVEGRKIGVDPDGGMPYLRDFWLDGRSIPEELSDGVSPTLAAYSDGGGLNGGSHVVSEGSLTRTRHLAVTYAFDHTEQALGFEPQAYTPENFARLTAKLEAGEPVRILVLGDSIFVGMSASSMVGFEPQLPPFFDLIKNELAARFYGGDADMIELVNVSVGGETSDYGVQLVEGGETDLVGFDFVMIGFGMNDGTLNVAPAAFTDNVERMIDGIRLHSPRRGLCGARLLHPQPELRLLRHPILLHRARPNAHGAKERRKVRMHLCRDVRHFRSHPREQTAGRDRL